MGIGDQKCIMKSKEATVGQTEKKCATFKNTDGSPKCHWGPEMHEEENWEEEAKKLIAAVEAALKKNGFTLESFQQQLGGLAKQLMSAKKDLAEDSEIGF